MVVAPGLVAVLRIGEMVRRGLSASSTPREVFGGGDARRKLASGGGRPERACAPSLSFSGISRRALGPWGPAPAMSLSLKGDGCA